VERNEGFVDPRISAAMHVTEASRYVSLATPALAMFVDKPIVLLTLIGPLCELYLAGVDLGVCSMQKAKPKR